MANVMVRMDDDFKKELTKNAKDLGLSLSAYIRSTMKERIKRKELVMERITREVENEPRIPGEQFLAEIQEMIKNA